MTETLKPSDECPRCQIRRRLSESKGCERGFRIGQLYLSGVHLKCTRCEAIYNPDGTAKGTDDAEPVA